MIISRIFTRDVRQVLFASLPIIFFGIPTIRYFLENNSQAVEAYGPFITIWALISISIGKSRYEHSINKWEQARLWQHLGHMEAKDSFRDEALTLTFDLHASEIAQIKAKLGEENPFCASNPEAIREFCESVHRRFAKGGDFIAKQKNNDEIMSEFDEKYRSEVNEMTSWSSYLWRVEIGMAIWGTVQGAYGEELMKIFEEISVLGS